MGSLFNDIRYAIRNGLAAIGAVIGLAGAFAISLLIHRYIEVPSARLRKRFARGAAVARPGAEAR